MLIFDSSKNKLHIRPEKHSPQDVLYVTERYVDIYSPKFSQSKYQELKKFLLNYLNLPSCTIILPYSQTF